jgi:ribosomal protein L11 methyltransferase PrmA/PRMT5 arginine-N-methyltransferase
MHSAASLDFKNQPLESVSSWRQDTTSLTNEAVHFFNSRSVVAHVIGQTVLAFLLNGGAAEMFSVRDYGDLISDRVRTQSYADALRRTVKPGSVVLDIGTGPGIFAILACQLGASRVFALEMQEIIQIARENAAVYSCPDGTACANRIEFIEDFSTNVTLPSQVDVIISDLHGALPLFGRHIPAIIDARQRFLRRGGALIPRKETLWAAVVEMPNLYNRLVNTWECNILDMPLASGRQLAINSFCQTHPEREQLLTAPELWATLNYSTIEDADVSGELSWNVERNAEGHGFIVWFDSDLADGVSFSNAPGKPSTIYGSLFFPWIHPVQLKKGETVRVQLESKLIGNEYAWRWATQVKAFGQDGNEREKFDQSSLAGSVFSLSQLRKQAAAYVPQLSSEGVLDRKILEMMDGRSTLEEISRKLAAEYPERFSVWHEAMKFVGGLSRKYSR